MSQLSQLIEKVKEEGLDKQTLEQYHTEITYLDNLMRMELAPIEKAEALYFGECKKHPLYTDTKRVVEESDVSIKRKWRATEKGQRQIELNHYLKITPKLLQSIRTRLYSIY